MSSLGCMMMPAQCSPFVPLCVVIKDTGQIKKGSSICACLCGVEFSQSIGSGRTTGK